MSITAIEYKLLGDLRKRGGLPARPHVIEFGEANWYGDVPLGQLLKDIGECVADRERRAHLEAELRRLAAEQDRDPDGWALWGIAKIFYEVFLEYESITAIDLHGTPEAMRLDLNQPVDLGRRFDIALNFGTGEHIFDICRFFRTVHEVTVPGGLMFHGAPFAGWVDHGFYTLQPTFYFDLALANQYEIGAVLYTGVDPPKVVQLRGREQVLAMAEKKEIGGNAMLYAMFRKPTEDREFRVPMQDYYAGTLSDRATETWTTLR